jgi:RNA polymerase sigma-70 factor (ECF subfamily)
VARAVALATGRSDIADDATQEAFEKAYTRWSRLQKHEWTGGWVTTTALNVAKRRLKRAGVEQRSADAEIGSVGEGAERVDVATALRALPFRQRQATILYYWADLPVAAIAELMGLTEGAVRAHLAHARRALRPDLEVLDV